MTGVDPLSRRSSRRLTRVPIRSDYPRVQVPVPRPLGVAPAFPFVGRSAELDALRSLLPLEDASGGGALVAGEAGSGKTRLMRELANEAVARGALVAYGAADAVVSAPYEPFVDALDFLVRSLDDEELGAALLPGGGELARLLPGLAARVPDLPAPAAADADTERSEERRVGKEGRSGWAR